MIVDIFFFKIVLILMIDYDVVVVPQSVQEKHNFFRCEIAFIENTEGNSIFESM